MKSQIVMSSGRTIELPMFDPIVAEHFNKESSYVGTLLHQINEEQMYAPLFKGKKDLVFLDIGANIGLVSIYASDSCSRIVAVEPAPDTFAVLQAMALKFPHIEPIWFALAPKDGPCEFFLNDINTTASSTVNTYGTLTSVEGLTLSSILRIYQLEHVDVAKIDAEGSEGESLSYEELEAAKGIVKSYYIETHNCPKSTWEQKMGVLVRHLSHLGYHRQEINGMCLTASQ